MTIERPRVLSVALASRKIAYVLLIDGKLKDWKRSRAGGMSAPKGRSFLSMAIKRHQPDLVLLGMPILFRVCLVGRSDPSTVRMISSYSEAGYLICRRPHPRSCFFFEQRFSSISSATISFRAADSDRNSFTTDAQSSGIQRPNCFLILRHLVHLRSIILR
jgi:hypothetical protein